MVVQTVPYLPQPVREIVHSVNDVTNGYENAQDRFTVQFYHGLTNQVGKELFRDGMQEDYQVPGVIAWLLMNFDYTVGGQGFGETSFDMVFLTDTKVDYTQDQRDEISFLPKLLPAYSLFMDFLDQNSSFEYIPRELRSHRLTFRPYWAGSDVNGGGDTNNLWKRNVDAIIVRGIQCKLVEIKNCLNGPNIQ